MWEYIKEHDLQDPSNRRKILPDAKLRTIFTPPLDMFSMNKQLSNHIYTDGGARPAPCLPIILDAIHSLPPTIRDLGDPQFAADLSPAMHLLQQ